MTADVPWLTWPATRSRPQGRHVTVPARRAERTRTNSAQVVAAHGAGTAIRAAASAEPSRRAWAGGGTRRPLRAEVPCTAVTATVRGGQSRGGAIQASWAVDASLGGRKGVGARWAGQSRWRRSPRRAVIPGQVRTRTAQAHARGITTQPVPVVRRRIDGIRLAKWLRIGPPAPCPLHPNAQKEWGSTGMSSRHITHPAEHGPLQSAVHRPASLPYRPPVHAWQE